MISWLKKLYNAVMSVINFVLLLVEGIIDLFEMLPDALSMLTGSLSALPSVVAGFAAAGITVAVIFLLVGRGRSN